MNKKGMFIMCLGLLMMLLAGSVVYLVRVILNINWGKSNLAFARLFFLKWKNWLVYLYYFLLCGCFPQSYQSIENKFKQDQCFKYHYQLLNKKQKLLYQIIYNIAYTRKQNIYIKEKEIDKVSKIVNAVLKDHPELFYIKEWSLNTKRSF